MPVGHLGAKYSSDVVPKRDSSKYETGSTSSSFSSSSSALSHVGGSHPHPPQGTANGGALRQVFSLENGDVTATTNGCSPPSFSSSAKTVLIVKCTDTSINAFNQAIATQRVSLTCTSLSLSYSQTPNPPPSLIQMRAKLIFLIV